LVALRAHLTGACGAIKSAEPKAKRTESLLPFAIFALPFDVSSLESQCPYELSFS